MNKAKHANMEGGGGSETRTREPGVCVCGGGGGGHDVVNVCTYVRAYRGALTPLLTIEHSNSPPSANDDTSFTGASNEHGLMLPDPPAGQLGPCAGLDALHPETA
jgi:hypothetical protein